MHVTRTEKAVRCDHDGLKMAEVKRGHLILRAKHHGETHVKIVPLEELEGGLSLPHDSLDLQTSRRL